MGAWIEINVTRKPGLSLRVAPVWGRGLKCVAYELAPFYVSSPPYGGVD